MSPTRPEFAFRSLAYAILLLCGSCAPSLALHASFAKHNLRTRAKELHNPLERINVLRTVMEPQESIVMQTNSSQLHRSGEWFEVSWSGVADPGFDDYIAVMVPAGADPTKTAPAKYKMAALSRSHLSEGHGSVTFRLISYRQDMQLYFVRGGLWAPRVAAAGPVITVVNPNQPLHGHLALTGDNTEMLVQWTTASSSNPVVRWGAAAGAHNAETPATSSSYSAQEMCGEPATSVGWVAPGLLHAAKLTGLVPGQRYYYVYGDEEWGFSEEASFMAAPPVGPDTSIKLLAVADMGQGEVDGSMEQSEMLPSVNTTNRMAAEGEDYTLLLHNGDISYARGYVTQWDNFMHQIEPLARRMPYMVAMGNHERDWPDSGDRFDSNEDSGGECGIAYERRFQMPTPGPDKAWYSYDYGPVHFLTYSTEHDFAPGSEQHAFIAADLARIDRAATPWVVLSGHRPMYISSNNQMQPDGDQPVAAALRAALEPLLLEHQVDFTWHGHHHSYQRSCQAAAGRCVQQPGRAPVHLVIGHGGFMLSPPELWPSPLWQTIKLWWGYMRCQANATNFDCQVISDLDGGIMDRVELRKPYTWGRDYMAARRRAAAMAAAAAAVKVQVPAAA